MGGIGNEGLFKGIILWFDCLPARTRSASRPLHSVLNSLAPVRLPSPPITHRLVMPSFTRLQAAFMRPSLVRKSLQRALPMTVPPLHMNAERKMIHFSVRSNSSLSIKWWKSSQKSRNSSRILLIQSCHTICPPWLLYLLYLSTFCNLYLTQVRENVRKKYFLCSCMFNLILNVTTKLSVASLHQVEGSSTEKKCIFLSWKFVHQLQK